MTSSEQYALVGGTIFDAHTGNLITGQAVYIRQGQIAAVCEPDALPGAIARVDVTGKTILPGMIDVHVHSEDWHAPLYLAKGITTVRDVGCELESVLKRRDHWNSNETHAPRLICTGPVLDSPGNTWQSMTWLVYTPEDARRQVDYLVERGVDQIKAYAFLNWPCFEAIVDQAHRRGKFVVAHLGKHTNARKAIEAGLDELEHLSGVGEAMWWEQNEANPKWEMMKLWSAIDADRMRSMVDLILEKGTWVAITRLVWIRLATLWDSRLFAHPQMQYVPEPLLKFWTTRFVHNMPPEVRQERSQQIAGMSLFTTELIRQGTKILIGTDAPFPHLLPGFSFHDELQALLDCGMSAKAAFRAATLDAAKALSIDHLTGSIERGKAADLVIVSGDPCMDFQKLQQIEMVIQQGKRMDPAALLAEAAKYARAAPPPSSPRFDTHY